MSWIIVELFMPRLSDFELKYIPADNPYVGSDSAVRLSLRSAKRAWIPVIYSDHVPHILLAKDPRGLQVVQSQQQAHHSTVIVYNP